MSCSIHYYMNVLNMVSLHNIHITFCKKILSIYHVTFHPIFYSLHAININTSFLSFTNINWCIYYFLHWYEQTKNMLLFVYSMAWLKLFYPLAKNVYIHVRVQFMWLMSLGLNTLMVSSILDAQDKMSLWWRWQCFWRHGTGITRMFMSLYVIAPIASRFTLPLILLKIG